ncbi:hypothetical protein KCP73_26295 [Salmonella enterica subsp. enterica]|nr:hypothetical protein KCP73_26295 [Salmonella enterica subsp. enterica]
MRSEQDIGTPVTAARRAKRRSESAFLRYAVTPDSDYRNVGAPSNTTNRRAFVDRQYDIVMAYRERKPVKSALRLVPVFRPTSGTLVTLIAALG